jgi:hypothetical protein
MRPGIIIQRAGTLKYHFMSHMFHRRIPEDHENSVIDTILQYGQTLYSGTQDTSSLADLCSRGRCIGIDGECK